MRAGGGGGLVAKSCPTLMTPWTVACQAPRSMGFSRLEYWSGCHFLLQEGRINYNLVLLENKYVVWNGFEANCAISRFSLSG